jgi:hypothetical protein
MAFKIKRFIPSSPINIEGVNPGKKLEKNITKKDHPAYSSSGVGSKLVSFEELRSSGNVPKGMENVFSGKGNLRVSKSYTGKKSSGRGEGTGQGNIPSSTKKPVTETKPVVEVKSKRKSSAKNTKIKASGQQSKLSQTNLGRKGQQKKFGDEVTLQSTRNNKKSAPKENTLDAINKVSIKSDKFIPASNKSKESPKDNSRKAIRKRKKADKAAGVSKSQMRANKAKSKSEAASAKAKKSKNPSYRAQLTAKSERLAKRAERKGGSPVKEVKQAKKPSKKNIDPKPTPKQKIDKDPVKHFNSFTSKATQRTAKNPYPKDSVRNRKFSQLQNNLRNSSR